jgi:drug/metabolite transporter (DMT)-like permease
MVAWLAPTLGYVLLVGTFGVFSKLALRSLGWQELLIWTAVVYAVAAAAMLASGQGFRWGTDAWWALAGALCLVSAAVLIYQALGHGDASKVFSVSAAYPAVTLLLSVIFFSEQLSAARVGGMLLVIVGVVVLTIAR